MYGPGKFLNICIYGGEIFWGKLVEWAGNGLLVGFVWAIRGLYGLFVGFVDTFGLLMGF
jgi:hypothetical protein